MVFNVLSATADKFRAVPIGEAALYALLGFAIIFAGIALLIAVVWALGKVMVAMNNKNAKPKTVAKQQAPAPTVISENKDEVDDETVAVIMAALMAYYQTNNPKCEFTVKRIKRI